MTVLGVVGSEGVLLVEVDPLAPHVAFAAFRFRPITDEKLQIFRRLLAPLPVEEAIAILARDKVEGA